MDKNYLLHVADSKIAYHKKKAKMAYEEKVMVIIELQKIKNEFILSRKDKKKSSKKVWNIQTQLYNPNLNKPEPNRSQSAVGR